ncbi:hypothetical protein TRFO_20648 [Tritrichomonas foetus]|uniref:Initiator binding domain-containing protein n=1 Tax=Tritrichomonas foetus TaxID=1144522 RepID=A0A1J4KL77_9EUKA|nr:hypothetical protein TRFO_20648 [Tritrichomonas foetus]|eukprot:OHT10125.1 hypothetical protein TRFO_20648 [Tritrichomonas foetus]
MTNSNQNNTPKYFEMLSSDDQKSFLELQSRLSSKKLRNNRGQRLSKFSEILHSIQSFVCKGDENDSIRALVCGVAWLPRGIAINTRQLSILIDKCKSSINGSLQRMGYIPVQTKGDQTSELVEKIPFLKNNFPELREWTVRQLAVSTPPAEFIPTSFSTNFNAVNNNSVTFFNPSPIVTSYSPEPQKLIFNGFNDTQISKNNKYSEEYVQHPKEISVANETQYHNYNENTENLTDNYGLHNSTFSDQEIYFDDPFCLPPTSLFDEDEDPFNSWQ